MNSQPDIAVKELVLIGGGHSHVGLLRMFAMNPLPGLRITLLASDIHTPYSGMLPGFIAGQYSFDDVHLDLRPLAEFAHARLYHTAVTRIDPQQRLVYSDHRPPVKYDLLSINIGSTPDDFNIPGVREYAIPVKPVKAFITQLDRIIDQALNNNEFEHICVVGGGASGVELIMAVQFRLARELTQKGRYVNGKTLKYTLITADQTILPSHNQSVQRRIKKLFKQRQINLLTDTFINNIELDTPGNKRLLGCKNGSVITSDAVIWCTSASPPDWPEQSGLAVDKKGFIQVNDYLQSVSHSNIFAAGDIASMVNHPRPKSGVYAVRQGPPLFRNLRQFAQGEKLTAYKPQKHFLSLLNCADRTAVASRGPFAFQGHWVWQYKDWIDVRFMKLFKEFPSMEQTSVPDINSNMLSGKALEKIKEIPMRCGGCGAKVGSTVLSRVLERLQQPDSNIQGIIVGMQQPDDAAVIEVPDGQVLVQSLDYFRAFIDDPFILGKIATNHALGDLYAMGATPHSALALVTLPYALEDIIEEELFQLMSGALEAVSEHQMQLLGGHTGEGAEMAFGMSVNGFARASEIMTKAGLKAGQKLILTKPLGTGVLLAANMRMKAKGRWIDEAINTMLCSSRQAAGIFKHFQVKGCTDITGFGLLGHLIEMLKSSKVSARIDLSSLPVLEGSYAMLAEGIFSSLQDENLRLRHAIKNLQAFTEHQAYPLLFDPQTAGGLLAGVDAEKADDCLRQLHKAGYYQAQIIGAVTDAEPFSEQSPQETVTSVTLTS